LASFWRGLGYFLAILIIIGGFVLFPIGLVGSAVGFVFIWMLRRSAQQEKMLKHLRNLDERDKADRKKLDEREKADRKKEKKRLDLEKK
jgi:UPF0716 family protein affecting phage T7 exclusion